MARGAGGAAKKAAGGLTSTLGAVATTMKAAPKRTAEHVVTDAGMRKRLRADDAAAKKAAQSRGELGTSASGWNRSGKERLGRTPAAERPVEGERQAALHAARKVDSGRLQVRSGERDALRVDPGRPEYPRHAAAAARRRQEELFYQRETFSPADRDAVWKDHAGDADSFVDVGGRTVYRDGARPPGEPTWQMGHVGGHEHADNVQRAIDEGQAPDAFRADYLDPKNYRPEHPDTNSSHQHEQRGS